MSRRYGSQWYKHYDGIPPEDDDNSYVWNKASQRWERDWEYDDETDEDALEEWEHSHRQKLAERNEF